MKHRKSIEQRWSEAVKILFAVNIIVTGIVIYLLVSRYYGNRDVPRVSSLIVLLLVFYLGNSVVYHFVRKIKNTVKDIVGNQ